MKWSLLALVMGFCIDLLIGDPHGIPHPVMGIGKEPVCRVHDRGPGHHPAG